MKFSLPFLCLLLPAVLFFGCKKEESQSEKDEKIIRDYLADHNITAIRHSSGLYYSIKSAGTGGSPSLTDEVKVTYSGYLTNGISFDSGTLDYYPLSALILGWQIGIPLLQEGGEATFFIPSGLGYGGRQAGSIPPNSVLIFDVLLVDFK
jgi:FKBP-type peptidyl-prolyl cis-trans isomerase FkpA